MKQKNVPKGPDTLGANPAHIKRDERAMSTYPGQASWGIAGESRSCRECIAWGFADDPVGYYAETGLPKPRECAHARLPSPKPKVPHYARACKYFMKNPEPPALEKPRPGKETANKETPK